MLTKAGKERNKRERAGTQPTKLKARAPGARPVPVNVTAADWKWALALCLWLGVTTLLVYSRVGGHPFVHYDDVTYVVQNSHVTAGLTWDTLTWALTATEASNWHPLTWLSHALDCQLFGLSAAGPHWMNAGIHALNAMILFLLLWRATGARWRSVLVAALFALHPLNVESVAWIAERKNVLSTLFFFLALGAYGWYARKPEVRRYLVVALLFVLGLASKPMVITLPFVLMLVDYWPLRRIEGWSEPSSSSSSSFSASGALAVPQWRLARLVLEKLPLLALSAGSAVITMVAQSESVVPTLALPFGLRLETAVYAYGMYLWKAIWPAHLALIYPHPGRGLPLWQPLVSGLLLVIVLGAAWAQRVTRPYLAVGWLWYLGTAVPVIGLVQVGVQAIADRYAYVPLIGVFVAAVWGTAELADRARVGVVARAVAASLILAALAFTTWRQIGFWESTADLWTHALEVTTGNSMAEKYLADELFQLGRYQEGMEHLRNYARVEPFDPDAHARVGADFQDHGQLPEAIQEYEKAIRGAATLSALGQPGLTPDTLAMTYANLGLSYAQAGDEAKARENMKKALDIDAEAVGRMISGLAQYLQQRPAAAGYVRLGLLLHETGGGTEAQQAFAKARQLDPGLALPTVAEAVRP